MCPVDMNVYLRFDEIPSMILQDIKETLSMHIQRVGGGGGSAEICHTYKIVVSKYSKSIADILQLKL